jgi:methionyl-tRNA formyltransferase
LIDVGTNCVDDPSKKQGYRTVGDIAFAECKEVAGKISPVPGGVGPMTIAMLLKNTLDSCIRSAAPVHADPRAAVPVPSPEEQLKEPLTDMSLCGGVTPDDGRKSGKTFAMLILKEHPYGRQMLKALLKQGHKPVIVIEEDGGRRGEQKERPSVATEEREKFIERIGAHRMVETLEAQCKANQIELVTVEHHNKADCLAHLKRVAPRLLLLGGTRIIRAPTLTFCPEGCLNAHPGLLPECRGSASPAWSVYHDIKVGSTCHFINEQIDEGDLLIRREVQVKRGYTYSDLCYHTQALSGELMAEAVGAWRDGALEGMRRKQGQSENPTFKNAPQEVLDEVGKKLKEQTYKHYVD